VKIVWNESERYFEAIFASGDQWRSDLEAAKAAGFKTGGPPAWTWYTGKAEVLTKLKKHRPEGITISETAMRMFTALNQQVQIKTELKKAFLAARKIDKKASPDHRISGMTTMKVPARGYIIASDLPPYVSTYEKYIPPPPPDERCLICDEPIYFYEYLVCLWCEKGIDGTQHKNVTEATSDGLGSPCTLSA
jgi:hypothetical protein